MSPGSSFNQALSHHDPAHQFVPPIFNLTPLVGLNDGVAGLRWAGPYRLRMSGPPTPPVLSGTWSWRHLSRNLLLAYQSLGVVYGDLSTSPLYVYRSVFMGKLQDYQTEEAVFGVFSLIFWTLTLVTLIKYVFVLLSADDNGEGGTFALYSLLCRHARFSLLPNQQAADEELSAYKYGPSALVVASSPLKRFLEKHKKLRTALLLFVLFGACMVIGDGVLTPAISVLSSLSGLQFTAKKLTGDQVLLMSCVVLVGLFALQHCGTRRVAFLFAPVVIIWLFCIFSIGIYNTIHWNPKILRALSPYYIYKFFRITGKDGWISLGGVLLCITGTEAMFADLGHFTALSIRMAFALLIYPCLVVQYMGQAAFLSKNLGSVETSFYDSIPSIACMTVMFITTWLMALVIIFVWQKSVLLAIAFLVFFGSIEAVYLSSAFIKVPQGGWVPLVLSLIFMIIMYIWHYGTRQKYSFDLHNKVSLKWLLGLGPSLGIVRVPGIGLIYSELATGVPAIFTHFVTNLPAFHKVLVFVCVKSVPVPSVSPEERFLVGRVCPRPYRMYRCIVRYGYKDVQKDDGDFERQLIQSIAQFIMMEAEESSQYASSECSSLDGRMAVISTNAERSTTSLIVSEHEEDYGVTSTVQSSKSPSLQSLRTLYEDETPQVRRRVRFQLPQNPSMDLSVRDELMDLIQAKEAGVAYIMGHSYIKARRSSSLLKKITIDIGYSFLRKNCRGPAVALNIPHISLIEVGMIYYV
ncbi:Potassium transporter 4 [Acorus calamus]|uniref:Potassium transporter 4 n=1 Tax=Acorus calamus TaxID=4465 RepID=A0AAV9EEV2_ACOCL|nr:Potassium transporter 4 [Acorus calamus]